MNPKNSGRMFPKRTIIQTMSKLCLTCLPGDEGKRLDAYLAEKTDLSRSAAAKLIESGDVKVKGQPVSKRYALRAGDEIELTLPEPKPSEALPEAIPLDIIYEDPDLIVINKPSGMVVHPSAGHDEGTLVNALLHHCRGELSGIGGVMRPGIVHRIDKDTSGLLVVAKNDFTHRKLSDDLKVHDISRVYHAIVIGHLKEERGVVDLPIGRNPNDRKKMAVLRDGKGRDAVTHYEVAERLDGFDHVICKLETGRTHQIRVHMSALSHPILGDPLYGGTGHPFIKAHKSLFDGQLLHAAELDLNHPRTGEKMHFSCPLPENMQKILTILRKA